MSRDKPIMWLPASPAIRYVKVGSRAGKYKTIYYVVDAEGQEYFLQRRQVAWAKKVLERAQRDGDADALAFSIGTGIERQDICEIRLNWATEAAR